MHHPTNKTTRPTTATATVLKRLNGDLRMDEGCVGTGAIGVNEGEQVVEGRMSDVRNAVCLVHVPHVYVWLCVMVMVMVCVWCLMVRACVYPRCTLSHYLLSLFT